MKSNHTLSLIFSIAFLFLVFTALFLTIDPLEKAAEKKDGRLSAAAETLVSAIDRYTQVKGRNPWSDDFGSNASFTPLGWARADAREVGICSDQQCGTGGDLIGAKAISADVFRTYTTENTWKFLHVGRGVSHQDSVNVCFIPSSASLRKNTGSLYKITLDQKQVPSSLELCRDDVTWKEEDVCWKCTER